MGSKARQFANLLGADGKIQTDQISPSAVSGALIADGSIDSADVGNLAIATHHIQDGAVTLAKTDSLFLNTEISGTEAARMPVGTTEQRANSKSGDIRFNSTTNLMEYYDGNNWKAIDSPPLISSINPTTTLSGGDIITITGENFQSGATVDFIGSNSVSVSSPSVSVDSATSIQATTPAAGLSVDNEPYSIKVTNVSGLSNTLEGVLDAGATPTWTTAAGSLGDVFVGESFSTTIVATDSDGQSVVYSITSGALPTGLSLTDSGDSAGLISGTESGSDTYASGGVTKTFEITATDGVNNTPRTFNIIKKWRDGQSSATATTPYTLRNIGITTDDNYWIYHDGMDSPIETYIDFNRRDSKDWVRLFVHTNRGTATVNHVGLNLKWRGYMITQPGGSEYYAYTTNYQLANARNTGDGDQDTLSGGNKSGYRVLMGYAGGMGFYNTSQNACSWSNSSGGVGAGYDGGSCGSWPNGLIMGTGGGGPSYSEQGGTWQHWIWMDTLT
jgi:hypothetical protein